MRMAAVPSPAGKGEASDKSPSAPSQSRKDVADGCSTCLVSSAQNASKKAENSAADRREDRAKAKEGQIIQVAGKSFRSVRSVWIDTQYKPEEPVALTRLVYGSAEFNQLLKGKPGLKPFFELRNVIVVWQGQAYQVEPQNSSR